MACLNSFDLIAYPGSRHVAIFSASTGLEFRQKLTDHLTLAGWSVTRSDIIGGGINDGVGYKAVSQIPSWCFATEAPIDWVPKCKLHIIPYQAFGSATVQYTEFKLMNDGETLSSPLNLIRLTPNIGNYTSYSYMFIGNAFQFFLFLLGSKQRQTDHVSDADTNIFAGVPQIPKFLQSRDSRCGYGVEDMSFMWQIPSRVSYLRGGQFAGIVTSSHGSWISVMPGPGRPMIHYDGDGVQDELPFYNIAFPETVSQWPGLFFPPLISWRSNPADADTEKLKGFLWDSVMVNKRYDVDATVTFDNHDFIVFNEWVGSPGSNIPAHSLMIATSGTF